MTDLLRISERNARARQLLLPPDLPEPLRPNRPLYNRPIALNPERIIEMVAIYFGLEVADISGRSKQAHHCHARYWAYYLMAMEMQWSYEESGRAMNRDHSTISYGVREILDMLSEDRNGETRYLNAHRNLANLRGLLKELIAG